VFIMSNKAITKDTELVLDYGLETYWVAMGSLIKDRDLVSGLQKEKDKEISHLKAKIKEIEESSTKVVKILESPSSPLTIRRAPKVAIENERKVPADMTDIGILTLFFIG
jgi:hypothetical protein